MSENNMAPQRTSARILSDLLAIEETEGEAHHLWDDAYSNLSHGRLNDEMRHNYYQQTLRATGLHAGAMDRLRTLYRLMQDVITGDAARESARESQLRVDLLFHVKLAEQHPDHPWLHTKAAQDNAALVAEIERLRMLLGGHQ